MTSISTQIYCQAEGAVSELGENAGSYHRIRWGCALGENAGFKHLLTFMLLLLPDVTSRIKTVCCILIINIVYKVTYIKVAFSFLDTKKYSQNPQLYYTVKWSCSWSSLCEGCKKTPVTFKGCDKICFQQIPASSPFFTILLTPIWNKKIKKCILPHQTQKSFLTIQTKLGHHHFHCHSILLREYLFYVCALLVC